MLLNVMTPAEANSIRAECLALEREGHAVEIDSQYTADGKFISVRYQHYLTCLRCASQNKETNSEHKGHSG